jgi:hypothetical protein
VNATEGGGNPRGDICSGWGGRRVMVEAEARFAPDGGGDRCVKDVIGRSEGFMWKRGGSLRV